MLFAISKRCKRTLAAAGIALTVAFLCLLPLAAHAVGRLQDMTRRIADLERHQTPPVPVFPYWPQRPVIND
jgi:cytochrome oxidase assembly protein ShyY1